MKGASIRAFSLLFLVPRFPPGSLSYGFGAAEGSAGFYLLPFAVGILLAGPSGGLLGRRTHPTGS